MSLSTTTEPMVLASFDSMSVFAFDCSTNIRRVHAQPSIAYVSSGSMSYRPWGRGFNLVPGSMLVGRPDVEYFCDHDIGVSGKGLSFRFSPELVEEIGHARIPASCDYLPPIPELVILGELAQSTVDGVADVGLDEIGVLLAHRCAEMAGNHSERQRTASAGRRRQVIDVAFWIEDNITKQIELQNTSNLAGMSPYHFLRVFTEVIGVTPHQYLIRCRLRRSARLLAESNNSVTDIALDTGFNDLSNFLKTFRRAAGVSPQRFRELVRNKRGIS